MVNCSIIGCKNRSERNQPTITFHRFPHTPFYRSKWIKSTGRVDWQPTKHSRMCSKHFESNCFQPSKKGTYMYLKLCSVPTLFIQDDDKSMTDNLSSSLPIKVDMDTDIKSTSVGDTSMTDNLSSNLPIKVDKDIDVESTSSRETMSASEVENAPQKQRLLEKLKKKTIVGENRRKKLAALRSKTWRLQKKSAKLSAVIKELKTRSLNNQGAADLLPSNDVRQYTYQIMKLKERLANMRQYKRKLQERISIQNQKIIRLRRAIKKPQGNKFWEQNIESIRKKQTIMNTFTEEIRKLVLTFNVISPKAYEFIRRTYKPSLPSSNVLETLWHQCYNEHPASKVEMLKNIWSGAKRKGNTTASE